MPNTASRLITATPKESTRDVLVRTAVALIDEIGEPHLRLETVLQRSGASVSSLYHYFGNLNGLLCAANIERFNRYVFADIEYLREHIIQISTNEQFRELVEKILGMIYSEDRRIQRRHRIDTVHHASASEDFASEIGARHKAAIEQLSSALELAKEKRFLRQDLDTLGFSAWFLGNSFGRGLLDIVDDEHISDLWLKTHKNACFQLLGM